MTYDESVVALNPVGKGAYSDEGEIEEEYKAAMSTAALKARLSRGFFRVWMNQRWRYMQNRRIMLKREAPSNEKDVCSRLVRMLHLSGGGLRIRRREDFIPVYILQGMIQNPERLRS
jgi:hypothetical protein